MFQACAPQDFPDCARQTVESAAHPGDCAPRLHVAVFGALPLDVVGAARGTEIQPQFRRRSLVGTCVLPVARGVRVIDETLVMPAPHDLGRARAHVGPRQRVVRLKFTEVNLTLREEIADDFDGFVTGNDTSQTSP